jgi:hypothetical protein
MTKETIEEGWLKFTRIHCKEGFIDRWMGDCINHPNNPEKSRLQLNMMVTYYRLNGGEWISDRDFGRSILITLLPMGEEFTAQEIWDEVLRQVNK